MDGDFGGGGWSHYGGLLVRRWEELEEIYGGGEEGRDGFEMIRGYLRRQTNSMETR